MAKNLAGLDYQQAENQEEFPVRSRYLVWQSQVEENFRALKTLGLPQMQENLSYHRSAVEACLPVAAWVALEVPQVARGAAAPRDLARIEETEDHLRQRPCCRTWST